MFKPLKTSGKSVTDATKTLLYAHHGFGKTFNARYYQQAYGKGFIISGESGLQSLSDTDIDYIPFSSWDGVHDPEANIYSFVGIVKMMRSVDFRSSGYTWLAVDSVTEMSERCLDHFQKLHENNKNAFELWGDYERAMVGYLKWLRDLPMHVLVTALAVEEEDDNGQTHYWPMLKMKKLQKLLPSLYDNVFCGIRKTIDHNDGTPPKVERYLVTDEVRGWHGKTRDPRQRLKSVERGSNVVALLQRIQMNDAAYEKWQNAQKDEAQNTASITKE